VNPFQYPEQKHSRSQSPRLFADYKHYKPFLQIEFGRQCVYCRLPDGTKGADTFGVDHYRPKARFPDLKCDYGNLFYACNACNRRKGTFWPSEEEWLQEIFIPNPCDHSMAEHLQYRGARVEPLTGAGRRAEEVLSLNGEIDVRYREVVLQTIEVYRFSIASGMATIAALDVQLEQEQGLTRDELLLERREIQSQLEGLQRSLENFTGRTLT
jgi:hypothetical protein